jgi:hypothetical protein
MWIKDNVICLDIPKCGTTSIYVAADYPTRLPHPEDSVSSQLGHAKHSRHIPIDIDITDKFIFCVVRNPYTRILSVWNQVNKQKKNLQRIELCKHHQFIFNNKYYTDFNYFLDICAEINKNIDPINNNEVFILDHCSCYIWTRSLPRLDFIIKLEEFDENKHYIPTIIHDLPVLKKSESKYPGNHNFIPTIQQYKRIEKIFEKDFHTYEYSSIPNRKWRK